MKIQPREGYLFDPDRYLFLEGRKDKKDKAAIPRVSDGVIFRVLSKLMLLDGERLSYRTLAVEQIGSVYQAIMGFSLQVATGRSIAIKPAKRHGAPATIDLETLLSTPSEKRSKWFTDETDQKLTGQAADALKSAQSIDELLIALERKIASNVTPMPVPKDAMVFQPSDERRKSGSHYTPSSLTGPIVEAALDPVLKQLGPKPTPAQILNLKVCDLAMGSAAFLVESCRQLGGALSKAWHAYSEVPVIPPDEDEALYAQRLVAQRCLYGLDKNQMAADLAKLSLWLATLAKDHPFTFLDHSLRHGDALVGLTRKQIASFHWAPAAQQSFLEEKIRQLVEFVSRQRQEILNARENTPYAQLEQELAAADGKLSLLRVVGDAAIAAFFSADKPKRREEERKRLLACTENDLKKFGFISVDGEIDQALEALRRGPKGVTPFHWELEFPEVFTTDATGSVVGGFDVVVGNPPFAGKNTIVAAHASSYIDWLQTIHPQSHGNSDLVAHFFRKAFTLIASSRCLGLIATNTICQGDTRSTGLRWICTQNGTIYRARRRLKWPGEAAVVVSVIHIAKGMVPEPVILNGRRVERITAYLFHAGGSEDPMHIRANEGKSFVGSYVLGMGFTFDDHSRGSASSLAEMHRLIEKDARNARRIFPYIGGEEILDSPTQEHRRYVINFEDWPLKREDLGHDWANADEETRKGWRRTNVMPLDYPDPVAADYPDLLAIVEEKVRPERQNQASIVNPARWWMFARPATDMQEAVRNLPRVLVSAQTSSTYAFTYSDAKRVFSHKLIVFAMPDWWQFSILQSRVHQEWVYFTGSTMKDDPVYAPSDCFETFPFPCQDEEHVARLERVGQQYYDFRTKLMLANKEGLTETYNRFNNPEESSVQIVHLRELHDSIDRAVLDTYGWTGIKPQCEFVPEFDYEDEEEEGGRQRKMKYRYRWPDDIRDDVLAQLLNLNRDRSSEEDQLLAKEAEKLAALKENGRRKKRASKTAASDTPLFVSERGDD
ncbi:MAG TPA: DNA methyltransferase [Terriglobales bacterium]|nr:DNA methyltransferase [Terriglobales bacterium]